MTERHLTPFDRVLSELEHALRTSVGGGVSQHVQRLPRQGFGIPDPEFGEALMAVVEPRPGAALEPGALRRELARRLADYKVPRHIELRPDLPREDSGKIFKRRLRDPYWEKAGRKI